MAGTSPNDARPRARRRRSRRQMRLRALELGAIAIGAVVLAALLLTHLLRKPGQDLTVSAPVEPTVAIRAAEPAEDSPPGPGEGGAQEPLDAVPVETPTAEPTPEPTPVPTPTAVPGSRPDVVSFYTPQGKSYSPRVRMGDTYSAPWKKGKDIGSFEVITSDEQLLDGSFFGDIFGAAWKQFPDADSCKIGYTLRYTLDDGTEIRYSMLSPKHIEHTEFIEVWLYDDYHREPHQFYSHLKDSQMKSNTLITSIKLTAGSQIARVTDIWLTAYVCASLDDFDAERNYIGDTSCTIHIVKG